ncbi:MAG: hypothetical protein PHU85_00175 [Phycisphaerae bacterium]|nr:hypothetical protein [Phycisphaerae bacterium]
MPTMEIVRGVRFNGVQFSKTETVTEEEAVELDLVVEASTVDEQHLLELDVSQLKALYFGADVAGELKLNSNSAEPIALDPSLPLLWSDGSGQDNPLGETDIESIYVTNSSTTASMILTFRGLLSSPL